VWHLARAGKAEEIERLLLEFHWLRAKLAALDVNAILADFQYAPRTRELYMVERAIRQSSHILAEDKSQLAGQLLARMLDTALPKLKLLLARSQPSESRVWLRPLTATLTAPDSPLIRSLQHPSSVFSVALSPDGRIAVCGDEQGAIHVWEVETGVRDRVLTGHVEQVLGLAVNRQASVVVSGGNDDTVRIWSLESGIQLHLMRGHSGGVLSVALTPDGSTAASGARDHTVKVWNVRTGEEISTLHGHSDEVTGVAISADGQRVISTSRDRTIRVWDLPSGGPPALLQAHAGGVNGIAVNDCWTRAVSVSDDTSAILWDLARSSTSNRQAGPAVS
jgi:WD40 repeat protein